MHSHRVPMRGAISPLAALSIGLVRPRWVPSASQVRACEHVVRELTRSILVPSPCYASCYAVMYALDNVLP